MYKFSLDYLNDFPDLGDYAQRIGYGGNVRSDFVGNLNEFLSTQLEIPPHSAQAVASSLYERMSDKLLHYHTPAHVISILQFHRNSVEAAGNEYELETASQVAIWFHNAVYHPGASQGENQSNSVLFMRAMLKPFVNNQDLLSLAADLIMETAFHLRYDEGVFERDQLLDLDLCSLSFPYASFDRIGIFIERELTSVYPENKVQEGRRRFLETLLSRQFIYRTLYFRQNYEIKARENLTRMLQSA